jgi:hypothetical protein
MWLHAPGAKILVKPLFMSASEPIQHGSNMKFVWRTASEVLRERMFGGMGSERSEPISVVVR